MAAACSKTFKHDLAPGTNLSNKLERVGPSLRRSGRRRGCAIGDGTVAAASERNRVGQRYQEARVAEGKRKLVAETDRRRRGDGDTRRRPK
jgi:hypothetical protein